MHETNVRDAELFDMVIGIISHIPIPIEPFRHLPLEANARFLSTSFGHSR